MSVYIGIDWSKTKHDVVFLNEKGAELAILSVPHSLEGFRMIDTTRQQFGLSLDECVIGIETAYNLYVDFLIDQQYRHMYIMPPNQVRASRGRFRQSEARDDPFDARLIADILRTDQGRLHPYIPDQPLTRKIRAQVHWLHTLTQQTIRYQNQLRDALQRYYPAALAVFRTGINSSIGLAFVRAYPTPQDAKALTQAAFFTFAHQHSYPHPQELAACYARLQAEYPAARPEVVNLYSDQATQLAQLLTLTHQVRNETLQTLQQCYRQHPKYAVFDSLPGVGEILGPWLLALFGDDLQRFPSPGSIQALAGTAPVTERSGKFHVVRFRRACDKEARYFCQEWANVLVHSTQNPIAVAYYSQVRSKCKTESAALRRVANRWLAVAWKLWQSNQTYNEETHFDHRKKRAQPR